MLFIYILIAIVVSILLTLLTQLLAYLRNSEVIRIGKSEVRISSDVDKSIREISEKVAEAKKQPRIYLSYSHVDSEFAQRLNRDLRKNGIGTWSLRSK